MVISSDIQELEDSLRQQEVVRDQETPAEEIARLKEASLADHINVDREVRPSGWSSESPVCGGKCYDVSVLKKEKKTFFSFFFYHGISHI